MRASLVSVEREVTLISSNTLPLDVAKSLEVKAFNGNAQGAGNPHPSLY
jgi:hypothetical protein